MTWRSVVFHLVTSSVLDYLDFICPSHSQTTTMWLYNAWACCCFPSSYMLHSWNLRYRHPKWLYFKGTSLSWSSFQVELYDIVYPYPLVKLFLKFLHVQVVSFMLGAIGTTTWKFRLERVDESYVSVEAEKNQTLFRISLWEIQQEMGRKLLQVGSYLEDVMRLVFGA